MLELFLMFFKIGLFTIGGGYAMIAIIEDAVVSQKKWMTHEEMMELLDDCMSFPNLLVRVRRYRHCVLRYLDENWEAREMKLDDDMAELIQHEYDHLDGILATMRGIDNKSFVMKRSQT